jgi:hypothetical protein
MHHKISHWARATLISQLDPDQFYVVFDNEMSKYNKLINKNGPEIAPLNTFTDDYDWRYEIKPDDIFDALDTEATWYKSTCFDTKEVKLYQIDADEK